MFSLSIGVWLTLGGYFYGSWKLCLLGASLVAYGFDRLLRFF